MRNLCTQGDLRRGVSILPQLSQQSVFFTLRAVRSPLFISIMSFSDLFFCLGGPFRERRLLSIGVTSMPSVSPSAYSTIGDAPYLRKRVGADCSRGRPTVLALRSAVDTRKVSEASGYSCVIGVCWGEGSSAAVDVGPMEVPLPDTMASQKRLRFGVASAPKGLCGGGGCEGIHMHSQERGLVTPSHGTLPLLSNWAPG